MPPNTATKLGQMGDVNANKEKLRKAIDFAKKNPDHPDAVELRKRLERGMFNVELKALGKQPFPVQQPKIDLKAAMAGVTQEPGLQTKLPEPEKPGMMETAKEMLGDVKETAVGVGKQFAKGAVNVFDTVTDDELNPAQKFAAVSGNVAATGAGILGELTIGAGKAALTQEAENKIKEVVSSIGETVADTEIARKAADWYEGLDKNDKVIVDSLGGIAALVTEMVGLKGASVAGRAVKEGAEATIDVAAPAIAKGVETAVDVTKQGVEAGAGLVQRAVTPSPAEVTKRIDEAVGRILQGKPEDIAAGRKALQQIDTKGVETYADLNNRIDDNIKALSIKVNEELGKYTEAYRPDQLGVYAKAGDETVVTTPVQDAIDGLMEAYTKSGEAVRAAKIKQLKTKLDNQGLTVKEINDLAREYNVEFKDRAFTAMGDPKPGYNAENYENVRRGVKDVVRERIPDEKAKELDKQMSDLYATADLTKKMEINVQKLYQKVKNRTLMQKAGAAAADLVDLVSLGTLRGFVQKILPSNVGLKTANSLDLQEELVKNLRTIEKLNKIEDPRAFALAFESYLKEPAIGMSIKSTVTPLKVGKEMTEKEFDLMADAIEDISLARTNPDFNDMLKKHGLSNAQDEELVKFMKEATDQFERPETAID